MGIHAKRWSSDQFSLNTLKRCQAGVPEGVRGDIQDLKVNIGIHYGEEEGDQARRERHYMSGWEVRSTVREILGDRGAKVSSRGEECQSSVAEE